MKRSRIYGLFLILLLLFSCGKETSSGFGSETSTGMVLSFITDTLQESGEVTYTIFDTMMQPLLQKTKKVDVSDTVTLDPGTYTVTATLVGGVRKSITHSVFVSSGLLKTVTDTLKKTGTLQVRYGNTLREKDISIGLSGTPFEKPLYYSEVFNATEQLLVFYELPPSIYGPITLFDERTKSTVEIIQKASIESGETLQIAANDSQWPIVDKRDGMMTANWYYIKEVEDSLIGKVDSVQTTLFPKGFSPLIAKGLNQTEVHESIGGAFSFTGLQYGIYNVVVSGGRSKQGLALDFSITNNQNLILSDTLRDAISLVVLIPDQLVDPEVIAYLEGTYFQLTGDLATPSSDITSYSLAFDSVPRNLSTRVRLVNRNKPNHIVASSASFLLLKDTTISVYYGCK